MVRKTFDQIVNEEYNKEENYAITSGDLNDIKDFCIKLMQFVRTQTLKKVADIAEADWNITDERAARHYIQTGGYFKDLEDIEVYVLKESILQLDKNSIQL